MIDESQIDVKACVAAFALALAMVGGAMDGPASAATTAATTWPTPVDATYVVPSFRFASGETMHALRLHYVTLGAPHRDAGGHVDNAVLVLHGTGGSGAQFLTPAYAGVLFAPGGLLDASRYFIIITDAIGHGASSKPSDGMHARFPQYRYADMVRAQYLVVTEALHVDHLRLVTGTSMGGMHTWLWGETYPAMMDALMPLASLPVRIAGRNRIWRDMIVGDLRDDASYANDDYATEPPSTQAANDVLWIFGSAADYDQRAFPTPVAADAYYTQTIVPRSRELDANDTIYALEASRDYDPESKLGSIVAPLVAINSADDEINPPSLGIMEREIGKVRRGRYVLLPIGPLTRGHGTHSLPAVWGTYLAELLEASSR